MYCKVNYAGAAPDRGAVARALSGLAPVVERSGGWEYENLATRVTCRWELDGGALTALVPVPRAGFFFREALPLILAAAERLGLGCSTEAELWAGWREANAAAIAAAGGSLPYCPPERSDYWWEYTRHRAALRLTWPSADVHIPDLLLFRHRETGQVALVTVLPEEEGNLVLPLADYAILKRTRTPMPGLSRGPAHTGLVPMAALRETLGETVQPHTDPVAHHLYRGGEAHPFRLASLRALAGEPAAAFAAVRPEEIVDQP